MKSKEQLLWHQRLLLASSIRRSIRLARDKPKAVASHLSDAEGLTRTLLWSLDPYNHD